MRRRGWRRDIYEGDGSAYQFKSKRIFSYEVRFEIEVLGGRNDMPLHQIMCEKVVYFIFEMLGFICCYHYNLAK